MLELKTFAKKNRRIQAVQVHVENMIDVAAWCGGTLWMSEAYVWVPVVKSREKKPNRAYVGHWVIKDPTGYKVYSDMQFRSIFEEHYSDEQLRKNVESLVKVAMLEQDAATYHQDPSKLPDIIDDITSKILKLFEV